MQRNNTLLPNPPGVPAKIGFGALVFFMFSVCSSVVDLTPGLRSIRPSLIAAVVGLLMLIASGRTGTLLRNKVSAAFLALTVWYLICVPFSVWPGGAVATIANQWLVTFLVLFMVGGLIWNSDQCRKIGHLIAYSGIILSVIALVLNEQEAGEGRLMLEGSRYGNPNDLALMVLTALPFICFMVMRKGNGIRRLVGLAGIPLIAWVVVKTGSRGALIGTLAALLTVFLSIRLGQKVKLVLIGSIVVAVLAVAVPSRVSGRFFTIFGDGDRSTDSTDRGSAIESAQARRMLLMDSISVTFQNPIFGVGAGNFQVAQDTMAKARGEVLGNWHMTHNTYTQISSESGLVGLLLFLTAIFSCFRSISRTLRIAVPPDSVEWQDLHGIAFALKVSLAAFLCIAVFDSLAYSPALTMLLGFSISVEYCANNLAMVSTPILPSQGRQPVHSSRRSGPVPTYPGRQLPSRM